MEVKYIRCGPHNISEQVHDDFYLEKGVLIKIYKYINI